MSNINKQQLRTFISQALQEDVGDGDHTSLATIPAGKQGQAQLIIKEDGILAGVAVALEIFNVVNPLLAIEVFIHDGAEVKVGDVALKVTGDIHAILMAERLVLNVMQRMSGIATTTHGLVQILKNTKTKILDTRKTTPGIRFLEKEAVRIGGGVNHRFGLYDMILIKDNHVDYAGGIKQALEAAGEYKKSLQKPIEIEIEVRNIKELKEVLVYGSVDRILLDNFGFKDLVEAVKLIDGKFVSEASGGIVPSNAKQFADCGVDYISMGALTHSVKSLDMSLKAQIVN
ncbi:carboxylating nicotinate-nucleotide diphosphorylase [Olivibacter domesticus]|uniref:Probable nicotinate-nucleotide pyrophosphorylase [carboxylating] n=1 Tax=Olivibacter domesticus TaxID=407022 RepID=A0A1H7LCZ4_OLID1|nr:carboxylating nicotinate-nucleotide diphosphorylase [Olivibacter domesticus]SEK96748.1 nicotinate-nucleotide pyrophosphorylase [carboxylating] [Olivibacter domesticus]